jgi:hypothetical protein
MSEASLYIKSGCPPPFGVGPTFSPRDHLHIGGHRKLFCKKVMLPFGSHQAPLYRGSRQNRLQGHPQKGVSYLKEERAHTHQDQQVG